MGAVKELEKNGAQIVDISLPVLQQALPVYYIIACAEASSNLGRYDGIRYGYRAKDFNDVEEMILKTRTEGFGDEVKRRIMLGTYVLSSGYYDAYYKKACLLRQNLIADFDDIFNTCDVLIAPTAPNTAFELGFEGASPVICIYPIGRFALSFLTGTLIAGTPVILIGTVAISDKYISTGEAPSKPSSKAVLGAVGAINTSQVLKISARNSMRRKFLMLLISTKS